MALPPYASVASVIAAAVAFFQLIIASPFPLAFGLPLKNSDIPLLRRLLVARIEDAVDDDGDEQNRRLDEVLIDIRNVEDCHGVQHDADEERAHDHVAHPAAPA